MIKENLTYQQASALLDAGKKLRRKSWDNSIYCVCRQLSPIDIVPWRHHPIVEELIKEERHSHKYLPSTWMLSSDKTIITDWQPTKEDMEASDWEIYLAKPHTCKVCNKKFDYGDEQSPVFKDDIWNHILKTYGFPELQPITEEHPNDDSGFICYECAEKALGRKIQRNDLKEVIFNEPFVKHYFNT